MSPLRLLTANVKLFEYGILLACVRLYGKKAYSKANDLTSVRTRAFHTHGSGFFPTPLDAIPNSLLGLSPINSNLA
jgi:hypothetical protein